MDKVAAIFVHPLSDKVMEVKKIFAQDKGIDSIEAKNLDEHLGLLKENQRVLWISTSPKLALEFMDKHRPKLEESGGVVIVVTKIMLTARITAKMRQMGVKEILQEDLSLKRLKDQIQAIIQAMNSLPVSQRTLPAVPPLVELPSAVASEVASSSSPWDRIFEVPDTPISNPPNLQQDQAMAEENILITEHVMPTLNFTGEAAAPVVLSPDQGEALAIPETVSHIRPATDGKSNHHRRLGLLVDVQNMLQDRLVPAKDVLLFMCKAIHKEKRGITDFISVSDGKGPLLDLFSSSLHFGDKSREEWESFKKAKNKEWRGITLPKWKDGTFKEERNEFTFPIFRGKTLKGIIHIKFRDKVEELEAAFIETFSECSRSIFLDTSNLALIGREAGGGNLPSVPPPHSKGNWFKARWSGLMAWLKREGSK